MPYDFSFINLFESDNVYIVGTFTNEKKIKLSKTIIKTFKMDGYHIQYYHFIVDNKHTLHPNKLSIVTDEGIARHYIFNLKSPKTNEIFALSSIKIRDPDILCNSDVLCNLKISYQLVSGILENEINKYYGIDCKKLIESGSYEYCRYAANNGHTIAMFIFAYINFIYYPELMKYIDINEEKSAEIALIYYTKAINNGYHKALTHLGVYYHYIGNIDMALEYFNKAIDNNIIEGYIGIAELFTDPEIIIANYTMAIDKGSKSAYNRLANYYYNNYNKDGIINEMYLMNASKLGHKEAEITLQKYIKTKYKEGVHKRLRLRH